MSDQQTPECEGEMFLGFGGAWCDQPGTIQAKDVSGQVHYFCARHHYFALFGEYEDGDPNENDGAADE